MAPAAAGRLVCPVLDDGVWLGTRASCSTEPQDDEDFVEQEEGWRRRCGGEAGGSLWFSFSIMVGSSLAETVTLLHLGCSVQHMSVVPAVF